MALMQKLLDKSIVFSFDRGGFRRHSQCFLPGALQVPMEGKQCLVTGANSGIGLETALGLARRKATVHMLCRNAERGAEARRWLMAQSDNPNINLHIVDIALMSSVRDFAQRLTTPSVDVLVHNAGLLPDEREVTVEGFELTVATHVLGPFLLTTLLKPRLRSARVVFVTSGGMYAKRFNFERMLATDRPYDGVASYAMTKRAQLILSEGWAKELKPTGTTVNAMHPGWAETPAVINSLPRFYHVMKHRLRTPAQGADTVLWLAIAEQPPGQTAKLWFDRQEVPKHLFPWTRERQRERDRLWAFCSQATASSTLQDAASSPRYSR